MFRTAFQAAYKLRAWTIPQRNLSTELRTKLDKVLKENKAVVFMKGNRDAPMCGFSKAVIQVLEVQGVDTYETVNVLASDEIRAGIKEYSEWPTIPQLYIDGEFIGGCDIVMNLHKTGELTEILRKSKLIE